MALCLELCLIKQMYSFPDHSTFLNTAFSLLSLSTLETIDHQDVSGTSHFDLHWMENSILAARLGAEGG